MQPNKIENQKNFIDKLEFTNTYFDKHNHELPLYEYQIPKKKLQEYIEIGHAINDDKIHTFICNSHFHNRSKKIIKKIFLLEKRSGKFHNFLLSNPTISLENKLKFILDSKEFKKRRVETFILALDINKNEVDQVKKIIHTFENITNTLVYTPNINDEKESSEIILALNIRLKTLIKKYESDTNE
jgi:hypothetical protein